MPYFLSKRVAVAAATLAFATACVAEKNSGPGTELRADIWADNWFALYVDEELVMEDPIPFMTEQSFNGASFTFNVELPAQGAMIVKDYYENDTGLEYIGERGRQQMGDGGFIAQFQDVDTGELIAASSSDWQCTAIHQAPLNKSCENSRDPESECQSLITEEPANWMSVSFDDSAWMSAVEYSERAIRPKRDYQSVRWASDAELVWTEDLEVDNVLLCRFTLDAS